MFTKNSAGIVDVHRRQGIDDRPPLRVFDRIFDHYFSPAASCFRLLLEMTGGCPVFIIACSYVRLHKSQIDHQEVL